MDTAPHYDHTGDTQRKPQGWPCDSIPHQDVGRSSREERSEGTHFALGPGHRLHAGGGWPGSESPEDRRASLGCLSRETGRPRAAGRWRCLSGMPEQRDGPARGRRALQTSCRAEEINLHSVKALSVC